LRQKRFEDAKALGSTAMTKRPFSPEPVAILAAVFVAEKDWEKAAQAYTDVLRLAGDNYPDINYEFIAGVFEQAGHPWKAWYYRLGSGQAQPTVPANTAAKTGSGKSVTAVNPTQDAQEFHDRGVAYAEARRFEEAEESLLISLKINPGFAGAWNNLCAVYLNMERGLDAVEACRHAVSIDSEYGDAHYNLALAFFRTNALKEAAAEAVLAKKWGREKEADMLLTIIEGKIK
jgi:tetratricopeptide (TPR) repeat protein